MKSALLFLLMGFLGFALPGKTWAAPVEEKEEQELREEQREMDEAKPATEKDRIDALAKQFNVPSSTVQDLRNKGQGWGEITIGLAMADRLAKTDPKTYPTLSNALQKVETLRTQGEGWGEISHDLGFKLGPVISEAKEAREELREQVRSHHPERAEHEERGGKFEHPDRLERIERPEHWDSGRPGR